MTLLKKEPLERYKQLRMECKLKSPKGFCCYWERKTNCSFLYCPFFHHAVDSKRKQALLDRQKYSVWFNVSDFDSKTSFQDLINEVRERKYSQSPQKNPISANMDEDMSDNISDLFGLPKHALLICQACGEDICDDNYVCIPDPLNPSHLRYYHSKPMCDFRKANVHIVREQWLHRQNEGWLEKVV